MVLNPQIQPGKSSDYGGERRTVSDTPARVTNSDFAAGFRIDLCGNQVCFPSIADIV
jgi:hypothetical protein